MKNILDQFNLSRHAAVITGGNRGLGFEIAKALAESGANIAILSRDSTKNRSAVDYIQKTYSVQCVSFECDVTNKGQLSSSIEAIHDQLGRIDVLVNSAGINIRGLIEKVAYSDFQKVMDVNVTGSWSACREVIPIMKKQGYGRILNISSMLGHIAIPERTPYCTSKGAVLQLTRSLAVEVGPNAITVNCICPGPFDTEIFAPVKNDPVKYEQFCESIPLGRIGRLDEIGGLALYLCSPASSYVTGAAISIDGGWIAR